MTIILWILAFFAGVWVYAQVWDRGTQKALTLRLVVPSHRVVEGDRTAIRIILENRSWLPLPWIGLHQPLPQGVEWVVDGKEYREIRFATYLMPRQRLEREYDLLCKQRGYHLLERAEVEISDGIGLNEQVERLSGGGRLLVRPRMVEDKELPIQYREMMGEIAVKRWYQGDPSRLSGIRPYQEGDPFKSIHWAASARTGEWMTKQFESTSQTHLYVLLNHQFFKMHRIGTISRQVDHQCRLAITLFCQAEEMGLDCGLISNAAWQGVEGLSIPSGRHPSHLNTLEAALGGVHSSSTEPFAETLKQARRRLNHHAALVIITGYWEEAIEEEVEKLRGDGHFPVLIFTGEKEQDTPVRVAATTPVLRLPLLDKQEVSA